MSKKEFAVAKLNAGVEGVIYLQLNADSHQYLLLLRQPTATLAPSNQTPTTLPQFAASQFQQEAQATGCSGPNDEAQDSISGSQDMSATFDCSQSKSQMERMIAAIHGSYAYLLYFVVNSSDFPADASPLNDVLASWRWLG